jgi:hypothetical protein
MKRNAIYYTLGDFIPKAVGFIRDLLYTRSLGPTELRVELRSRTLILMFYWFFI